MAIELNQHGVYHLDNLQAAECLAKAVLMENCNLSSDAADFILEWGSEFVMGDDGQYTGVGKKYVFEKPVLIQITDEETIEEYRKEREDEIAFEDVAFEGLIVFDPYRY